MSYCIGQGTDACEDWNIISSFCPSKHMKTHPVTTNHKGRTTFGLMRKVFMSKRSFIHLIFHLMTSESGQTAGSQFLKTIEIIKNKHY